MLIASPSFARSWKPSGAVVVSSEPIGSIPAVPQIGGGSTVMFRCGEDTDGDDEDLADDEDLSTAEADVDEESAFDDFDDEFDDDFEEEENDPDWDHPEDTESDEPPPAKGPAKKK